MGDSQARAPALKKELNAWIKKNGLTEDTIWWKPEEFQEYRETDSRPALVLTFEGDLHTVLWERDGSSSYKLRAEFDEIVHRRGFDFNFKDEVTGVFYRRRSVSTRRKSTDD
jgi:hypothetical protein